MAGEKDAEKMLLHVWKGDWGLPSIDPNCLSVLAFCKFSGVPMNVKVTGNPWRSPTGQLPCLSHKDTKLNKVCDIFAYLRRQNWGCDFDLTTVQSADVVAFSSMLEEKLLPALLHLWWIDGKTYVDFTRPWYTKIVPFPLNFFIPGRKQKAASLRVFLTKGGDNINDSDVEAKIYKEAKECMNLLSYKLGENEYMFGKQPSSLDALVFGYLVPILKAPLPSNQLLSHLRQCDNLVVLMDKILQRFFPHNKAEVQAKHQREESARRKPREASSGVVSTSSDDVEFPNKRRNMILAAIFAGAAMLSYASLSGLVRVRVLDSSSSTSSNSNNSSIVCGRGGGGGATPRPPDLTASGFDPLFEEKGNEQDQEQ